MYIDQNTCCDDDDDDERIRVLMQKIEEEYIRLGKRMISLVLDASRRIDSYVDEVIMIQQKREEKNK